MSSKQNNSGKLSFAECYSISIGFVIGVGIITMTGIAIGYTGVGVSLAFVLAGLALLIMEVPKMLAASVVPKTSMSYILATSIEPRFGGVFVYMSAFSITSCALMSVTFVTYLSDMVSLPINGTVLAVAIFAIMFLINLFGVKNVALAQTIMNVVLIIAWGSFLVFGLPQVNYSLFTVPNMFTNGFFGMFTAVATLQFAMGGGTWTSESAGRIQNPEKNVFKVNFATTGTAMLLFALISMVASGILPVSEVANQSLTLVAQSIYPGSTYVLFVVGGALIAIITTMNASILQSVNSLYRSTKDGWFPKSFEKENAQGVPVYALALLFVIGAIVVGSGFDTTLLSRVVSGAFLMMKFLPAIGCYFFLKQNEEIWKQSKYYMSDGKLKAVCGVSLALITLFIGNSFLAYPAYLVALIAGLIVVMFIVASIRKKTYLEIIANRTEEQEAQIR